MMTRSPVCVPCVLSGAAVVALVAVAVWQVVGQLRRQ